MELLTNFFLTFSFVICLEAIADNVSGLCDGGAIEAQIFNFVQKLNRRTAVELCSFALTIVKPLLAVVFKHHNKMG